jgi:antitoxin FitA
MIGVNALATLTVRGLDDETRDRLRVRAARNGRSMEAEVRAILRELLSPSAPEAGLGSQIHARFAAAGAFDLDLPPRSEMPRAAVFGE